MGYVSDAYRLASGLDIQTHSNEGPCAVLVHPSKEHRHETLKHTRRRMRSKRRYRMHFSPQTLRVNCGLRHVSTYVLLANGTGADVKAKSKARADFKVRAIRGRCLVSTKLRLAGPEAARCFRMGEEAVSRRERRPSGSDLDIPPSPATSKPLTVLEHATANEMSRVQTLLQRLGTAFVFSRRRL
jgi:hypothetical protein